MIYLFRHADKSATPAVAELEAPAAASTEADAGGVDGLQVADQSSAREGESAASKAAPAPAAVSLAAGTSEEVDEASGTGTTARPVTQHSASTTADVVVAQAAEAVAKLRLDADGTLRLHIDNAASTAGVAVS